MAETLAEGCEAPQRVARSVSFSDEDANANASAEQPRPPSMVSELKDFSESTRAKVRRQSSADRGVSMHCLKSEPDAEEEHVVSASDFDLLAVVGKGAYGRVLQVRESGTGQVYAMKVLQKGHVIEKNNMEYVREERNILSQADHPFVVKLMCAFQTQDKLYLVMEYVCGGELFSHIRNEGIFSEDEARFYSAEMVLAIEYLHQNGIIHRDLKPENVLLDQNGHIRITDFGLAKVDRENKKEARTLCGTDLYMAPEMLACDKSQVGYGKAVDFWSLGVILFEMLTGDTPFYAKDTHRLYRLILSSKPKFPRWMSSNSMALLKGLLNKNVEQRLGAAESTMFKTRGVQELKSHEFYKSIDWNKLERLELKPPIQPNLEKGTEDISNFAKIFTELDPQEDEENLEDLAEHLQKETEDDFKGFSFTRSSYLETTMSARKKKQQDSLLSSTKIPSVGSDFEEVTDSTDSTSLSNSRPSSVSDHSEVISEASRSNSQELHLVNPEEKAQTVIPSSTEYFTAHKVSSSYSPKKSSGLHTLKQSEQAPNTGSNLSLSTPSLKPPSKLKAPASLNPNAKEWVPSWMK